MSLTHRIFPGNFPPTIGSPTLTARLGSSFAPVDSFYYTLDITVTINGSPPPLKQWAAYVASDPSSTGTFATMASTVVFPSVGSNNLSLISTITKSHYAKLIVGYADLSGNFLSPVSASSSVQLSVKKAYLYTYYNQQTFFTHPGGTATYDILFTSQGGKGNGTVGFPGSNLFGGGGAGVKITGVTVDGSTYYVDNRKSQSACYLRKTSDANTTDQIYAGNGGDATTIADGTPASSATVAGFFAGFTTAANNGGNATTVGFGNTYYGGRSGIHAVDNPVYPETLSDTTFFGCTGQVDDDGDGNLELVIRDARAFGCAGYSVTFPGGNPVGGEGQSGCVQLIYYV